ncbi:DNA-directed RNA polymerase I complex large subunit Nuc1 [Jimgerdemannia flammicorona]|uniref:DNA-directed RNA polymerase subunit n=1 Tax=Jimgerdemannia flammicorona TaxID=994334 RepID=A0A433QWF9_9FUNG|nr:DNA-directed RNA polymerase I complex large subunit Nuc1 [Jimgerdemannia flammicorona]
MGANNWRNCATCQLDHFSCPGHFGHIELPVPVFNPLFLNHLFAILRAKCFYCHKFRMGKVESHRLAAKLTLLQHGLIFEAQGLDQLRPHIGKGKKKAMEEEAAENVDLDDGDHEEEGADAFMRKIDCYVKHALAEELSERSSTGSYKVTLINDERKKVMGEFLKRVIAKKKCENCGAYARAIRKDGFAKVFLLSLTKKQQMHMDAHGMVATDVLFMKKKVADRVSTGNVTEVYDDEAEEDGYNARDVENANNGEDDREENMMVTNHAEETSEEEGNGEEENAKRKTNGSGAGEVDEKRSIGTRQTYMTPIHVRDHIRLLFEREQRITSLIYGARGPHSRKTNRASPDLFFIETLPVAPTRFRPASVMGDKLFESPQNQLLSKILNACDRVRDLNTAFKAAMTDSKHPLRTERTRAFDLLVSGIIQLQHDVNSFIDSTKNPMVLKGRQLPPAGIRQALEKKEGLFRKHMMGKRVNYAARSVISPDPNIETSEIGIPPVFAKKLTYPEPVTHYNIKEMMRAVINGPEKWPGSTYVQHEDGSLISLANLSVESRIALANTLLTPQDSTVSSSVTGAYPVRTQPTNKKVYRHLRNGDLLLLNRQPTLHKPSIMAHRARVLPGEKTIRMHYANCNTYNADFDGDEMNVHFPQNEIARAEATLIANTDNQYLVPTSGNPLRGLIQDHVVTGVWMTSRDTFLSREEYMQILYGALRPEDDGTGGGRVLTVPPAIRKPLPMWTGKQVISTILGNLTVGHPPLNMSSKAKVPGKYWGPHGLEEGTILFMDGELITGVLDKSQFGASSFGMVHSCYELYGPPVAGKLLSILGRLFTKYVQWKGFSCRMDDLRLTEDGDKWRRNLIDKGKNDGADAHMEYMGLAETAKIADKETLDRGKAGLVLCDLHPCHMLDRLSCLGAFLIAACASYVVMVTDGLSLGIFYSEFQLHMEEVLRDDEKLAGLDNALKTKMNKLTSSIIGKCIPDGLLKLFPQNNMQMMTVSGAKGSPVNVSQISCLLGNSLNCFTYALLCMSFSILMHCLRNVLSSAGQQELEGRRVPIMVSGKSLPSFQPFSTEARAGGYISGRFLTGIRPQEYYFHCMAGREGLIDTAVKTSRSGYLQRCLIKHLEGLRVHYDHTVRDADGSVLQFHYGQDSLDVVKQKHLFQFSFSAQNLEALSQKYNPHAALNALDTEIGEDYSRRALKKPHKYDPALSKYSPSRHLGVVSERFQQALKTFIEENPDNLPFGKDSKITKNNERFAGLTKNKFKALMHLKYLHSLVEPGEAVGLLAAQSVGEPSTQMTLNTFHFAGFGAKNVTLGIPRLREIVMTASANIKTPTMLLSLLPTVTNDRSTSFCKDASRLALSQIMDEVRVTERMAGKTAATGYQRHKIYNIRLHFFTKNEYLEEYNVRPAHIEDVIERAFVKKLENAILRDLRKVYRKSKGNIAETDEIEIGKPIRQTRAKDNGADDTESVGQNGDESDDGDGDATATRLANRGAQHATYDAPDEDDEEVIQAMDKSLDQEEELDAEMAENSDDNSIDDIDKEAKILATAAVVKRQKAREDRILEASAYVKKYRFDNTDGVWCEIEMQFPADTKKILMVSIVEKVCHDVIIHEIPGISRCFQYINPTENDKTKSLATEGVNLRGMWLYNDVIDVNKISTNDIAAMLRTYGVEAARATLMNEISGVFEAYGIEVDPRHLTLIADYMTFEGGYKPFNRTGIESNVSPFLKMSFETTCHFLTQATLHGDFDMLDSPSARLVMGKVVGGGTGSFEILQPVVHI